MSDRIAEALKRLDSDIELSKKIAERHTRIDSSRLADLYGRAPIPTIFTPDEAKETGIVDEIIELNPTGKPEPNVAVWVS